MIRSVRQSARRFLTTDAERKGRRHRCNRALRDQRLDMVLLFAQGLAELIQGGLDLVGEGVGAIFGGVEHSVAIVVQEARYLTLERLQLITQLA